MNATTDRPTALELDELSDLLAVHPLDHGKLVDALRGIEQGLHEHGRELDRSGGLLDEADKAHRMSLARQDERLRDEVSALLGDVEQFRRDAADGRDDEAIRRRGSALLAALRGHRDAEASLVLESADTEVGSGD
ncbi:MAG TPA: hypothetical protein VKD90_22390 [Gemmataceae bacterium]|nr:hypothetical protein [Gemmataceae bacterium]